MSKHFIHDFLAAHFSRFNYRIITPEAAREAMALPETLVLDVRTPAEYAEAHIPGSINIPVSELRRDARRRLPDKTQLIVVYCLSGARARAASRILAGRDYTNVATFGGIMQWPYETVKEK